MTDFAHLHVHTEYSLLDGLSKIPKLVTQAKIMGMKHLAMTDHGAMYGALKFYKECKEQGVNPILGCEMYIAKRSHTDKEVLEDKEYCHLTVLAKNYEGYKNLLELVTQSFLEGFYYRPRVDKKLLAKHANGLMALSGCHSSEVSKAFIEGDMTKATNDIHYVMSHDAQAQDAIVCIQPGKNISDTKRLRMIDSPTYYLKSADEMAELFEDIPEAIENSVKVAEKVNIDIPFGKYSFPHYEVPKETTADEYLKKLCYERIESRVGKVTPDIKERLDYELSVISQKGYSTYFLVVADFVNWSRDKGIISTTRGSASGSLVSFALGITTVDPLYFKLPFERFLNLYRPS